MSDTEARWYVAHTYSGYENKVKMDIEKTVENRNLQDQILEVSVPMLSEEEEKGDTKRTVERKMFPAYVLVHMIMNDDTWYVVRNTRGVTGFVGPGSKPVPLTDEEMMSMGLASGKTSCEFNIGDSVVVKKGVWENTTGMIKAINHANETITINVDMFGRETPVEIAFADVEKV